MLKSGRKAFVLAATANIPVIPETLQPYQNLPFVHDQKSRHLIHQRDAASGAQSA
jgi:hypothetical protein